MQSEGAALPWGSAQERGAAPPDVPASLGMQIGDRVEVLWSVGDDTESSNKWWGAAIHRRVEGNVDGEGRPVYALRYDPDPDQGFEEHEECEVTFVEEHSLYDLALDSELPWRREGEAWEAPVPADDDCAVLSAGQIVADIERGERLRGRTLEQDTAEALSELAPALQRRIAAGYLSLKEHLTEFLLKVAEQRGPDYVVTAEDVQAATAAAKASMAQGGGL